MERFLHALRARWRLVRRRGPRYVGYLVIGLPWARTYLELARRYPNAHRRWVALSYRLADRRLRSLARARTPSAPVTGFHSSDGPEALAANEIGIPEIRASVARLDGVVLLCLDFRGARSRFVDTWAALVHLPVETGRPGVHHVDERRARIYVEHPQPSTPLDHDHLIRTDDRCRTVADLVDRVHACGVTGLNLATANRVANRGLLPLLARATFHPRKESLRFAAARDRDREAANATYGCDLLTEAKARDRLSGLVSVPNEEARSTGWYGAIDFGHGLTVGKVSTTESGTGRWEFLNGPVMGPLVAGKRVLDLGSNNGVMPLLMLRAGATRVTGVERSADHIRSAKAIQEIFEWRDITRYDLHLVNAGMKEYLDSQPIEADVATALCSLYYLSTRDMVSAISILAARVPVLVLQANVEHLQPEIVDEHTEGRLQHLADSGGVLQKSSIEVMTAAMELGGYSSPTVYAPRGYSRPLLVGTRDVN